MRPMIQGMFGRKGALLVGIVALVMPSLALASRGVSSDHENDGLDGTCKDPSANAAGCQPSTFDPPLGKIPSRRVNAKGEIDPFSTDADAVAGAFRLERKLGLSRNFEHLHWVPTLPSKINPITGAKFGGDLDADGRLKRGIGIAGDCIYVGYGNGVGFANGMSIFRIQPNPEFNPPVRVDATPDFAAFVDANGNGFSDRELRALRYTTTSGGDRMLLVRDATNPSVTQGIVQVFAIDPATCLPISRSNNFVMGGEMHEFYLWDDPKNPNRVLVVGATFDGAGRPNPNDLGRKIPDAFILAITDEVTGEVLSNLKVAAGFALQDVGGPPLDELPDATGLFSDGRFADYSHLKDSYGVPLRKMTKQHNRLHSLSMSADGERVYVAHGTAGFYILNSVSIATQTNADLIAGTAGCNKLSTNVFVGGTIGGDVNASMLPQVANDCLHMVVNDDPGLKAFLASSATNEKKIQRYQTLISRARMDTAPPIGASTGTHSAVMVPNRPSLDKSNTTDRPAFVIIVDEKGNCPVDGLRIVAVDSEITPALIGAFTVPIVQIENCMFQATTEPDGQTRRRRLMSVHNPTVFENLVFITWFGQGLRVIDISQPHTPREVGHVVTVPHGQAVSYPIFKDGLIYWMDDNTGIHVGKYTGPRADELPDPGSGVVEGNATSPHL